MKTIAKLLLFSSYATDEIQATETHIWTYNEEKQQGYSEMVTDLDSFSFEQDKNDEGSSGDDEQASEEAAEEEPKQTPEKKVIAVPQLKYGRDKNGLYNNHKHFVHLRNKINNMEQGHQALFDRINKRLREEDFIQSQDTQLVQLPTNSMTDTDIQCYKDRYSDVKATDAPNIKNHYRTLGKAQGRLNTCAENITDFQAQYLLEKTPALQRLYGHDLEKVRNNYISLGSKATTTYDITLDDRQPKPWFCGYEELTGNKQHKCGCDGVIHFGLSYDLLTKEKTDFSTIRQWNHYSKFNKLQDNKEEYPDCSTATFGTVDQWPNEQKSCWCEPKIRHFPNKCADEGEDCLCEGNIYFMAGDKKHYMDAIDSNYTVNFVNGTSSIACKADSFEFTDPLPGTKKQCMCDNQKTATTEEAVQVIKDEWRNKKYLNELHDALYQAEQLRDTTKNEGDAAQSEVDGIVVTPGGMTIGEQEDRDDKIIDDMNKTGMATCEAAKKTAMDKADADKKALKTSDDAAAAAVLKANASLALGIKEPTEANAKAAKADEQAAIDASIVAAVAREIVSNAEVAAGLYYDQCILRLNQVLSVKKGDLTCEREAQAALDEASLSHDDQLKILEAQHRKNLAADEALHYAELLKLIAEAKEKELKLHRHRERLAREQHEKDKANYDAEMQRIRLSIAEAQELANAHIAELKKDAEELMAAAKKTAEWQIKRDKEAIEQKRKLEEKEYAKNKEENDAKAKLLAAQKAEELAKTTQEVFTAQEEAKAAQKAIDEAEEEKRKIADTKAALQEEIITLMAQSNLAKEKATEAAAQQKKFEEMAEAHKKAADDMIKTTKAQMVKEQANFDQFKKDQEAELAKQQAAYDATLKAMKDAFAALKIAQQEAFAADERAREMQEAKAEREQKRQMDLRRSAFVDKFKHVFENGMPGVSIVEYTIDSMEISQQLLSYLFRKHLIADAQEFAQNLHRVNLQQGAMGPVMNRHKINLITSDARVAELIDELVAQKGKSIDVTVMSCATGNKNYIEWVKQATSTDDKTAEKKPEIVVWEQPEFKK